MSAVNDTEGSSKPAEEASAPVPAAPPPTPVAAPAPKSNSQAAPNLKDLPMLDVTLLEPGPKKVGSKFEVEAIFINPLNDTLTECAFIVTGPGLLRPLEVTHWDIFPNSDVTKSFIFRPRDPGEHKISVDFRSTQLAHAKGTLMVTIVE